MNKCEKIMAEKMNFVSRRGRTAERQKEQWLRRMRDERKTIPQEWCRCYLVGLMGFTRCRIYARNWQQMKLNVKKISFSQNEPIDVYDDATRIFLTTINTEHTA